MEVVGSGEGGFALAALAAGTASLLDNLGVLRVVETQKSLSRMGLARQGSPLSVFALQIGFFGTTSDYFLTTSTR